jgi:phosphate/sulfate permease
MIESVYIGIVVILFLLAISDLIVGVSNDAVNFLNSAIGSRAARFRTIMIVAGIGILIGATFSNGMMEVARKGIFHPQKLVFSEIMILFLAVMLTDIILLDTFNTFGLPTSTTVSIVFELLGATLAIAVIKSTANESSQLMEFINSEKALEIIIGIFVAIFVAFTAGAVIQYIVRILFSFNYERTYKYFGSVFGGIAVAAITYFLLIKGAKGSSFIDKVTLHWIKNNTWTLLILSFIVWTAILQALSSLFKINIFKIIVLIGTFTLAMAFAGNDLVNFIGVPLAGLSSYKSYIAEGADPELFNMIALQKPVETPTMYLLIAGLIMTVTLWLSKKARSVTTTTITLGRQEEGDERFQSFALSRFLVRSFIVMGYWINKLIPGNMQKWLNKRFETNHISPKIKEENKGAHFDLIRASVILFVSSIIISLWTSMTIPLSTTYVTFMVAMGSSLADRAWGRESAVYRISGVLTVIGGWLLTALIAATVAFIMAMIIHFGGEIAIVILLAIVIFTLIQTHVFFNKREKEKQEFSQLIEINDPHKGLQKLQENTLSVLTKIPGIIDNDFNGLFHEKRNGLKKDKKEIKKIKKEIDFVKDHLHIEIMKLQDGAIEVGNYYIQILDKLKSIANTTMELTNDIYAHINNQHKPLLKEQHEELETINRQIHDLINEIIKAYKENHEFQPSFLLQSNDLFKKFDEFARNQINRINKHKISKRNSQLFFTILSNSKEIILKLIELYKTEKDFYVITNKY